LNFDVAIVGGGPAGSTLGALLKKYRPNLSVAIFERDLFPRDHVGESQLPPISHILDEMGCWEAVEKANFPIKIGATYKWGKDKELWNVDFAPAESINGQTRPGTFDKVRQTTAFQVDRAIYDKILLDHAKDLGCQVFEETKVARIATKSSSVEGLELGSGETVTARYYIDASGHSGMLRRAMNVKVDYPSTLQNLALWEYWQNAEWAVDFGQGATRIQVMSLPYGWLWFIPLGPTRTSVGLVLPVEYFKNCKQRPEELYMQAVYEDPLIADLLRNAQREDKFQTTKDWSFLAEKHFGLNWFLVGESAGFADPILSAGLTVT
jgi:flavin-dependent dehydrogenase